MRFYTVEQLSPKISETPEGFLLCESVPVARTGEMTYKAGEVPVKDRGGVVTIKRTEDVVFDDVTIRSFEGKPVTLDHPDDFVTPENWTELAHGTVQNVRRGTGEQDDLLLADLLITTVKAIELVKSGLREVSCGYDADYAELEAGLGEQKNIIGNHIALVDKGRAGSRCAIGDKASTHRDYCEGINYRKKTEDEGMKMKIKSKVMDAIKRIKDAVEAEIGALPDDDEKKKKEGKFLNDTPDDQKYEGYGGKGKFLNENYTGKDKKMKDKKVKDTEEPPAGKSEPIGKVVEGVKVLSGDQEPDVEGTTPPDVSVIKEKAEELLSLLDEVVGEEEEVSSEEGSQEEPPLEERMSEEESTDQEEGEGSDTSAILARLDKLEAVIAELVKSDEEVHAAMDSIMRGEGDEEEDDEKKKSEEEEVKDGEFSGSISPVGGSGKSPIRGSAIMAGNEELSPSDVVDSDESDEEDKKKEDEENGGAKGATNDSWNDVAYRVGILAPEMNIAKPTKRFPQIIETIKREALKKAFTTDTDSVKPFIRNKNINNLTGATLDAAFVGASELIAKLNNQRVQRGSMKVYDAGSEVANTVRAINEKNKAFWKR